MTSPSANQSDPWLSMVGQMNRQRAKTTPKQRSPGGTTTNGLKTDEQLCFRLSKLRLYIRDLGWISLLIGAGLSAFTTGDMWVLPSLLVLLCVGATSTGGNSSLL